MSKSLYLDELNQQQLEAVTSDPCNLLVLAGAGSGKTRVLVSRIAWLLQNFDISPFNILAVTFTNKAANQMRTRLNDILNFDPYNMWVGTFHGLAHRLLQRHFNEAGLLKSFQIIDALDQTRLIKQVYKLLNVNEEKWPIKQAQWFINNINNKKKTN